MTFASRPAVAIGDLPQIATAGDSICRGELAAVDGRSIFRAVRKMRWGTEVVNERPLLLVEADSDMYLRAQDADLRLVELADALRDPVRVATYVAFKQLHERRQKEVLALWTEGIETSDEVAGHVFRQNQAGVDLFIRENPEFGKRIYWNHFVLVASIFGRFGTRNEDGTYALYALSSHLQHSCQPNTAVFVLKKGFPKGRRMLHIIATEGVHKNEELTISMIPEPALLLPKSERIARVLCHTGRECDCNRCSGQPNNLPSEFEHLDALLAIRPPTDESTKEAHACLKRLERALPFSMQLKAKAKVLLANAMGELSARAAWQDENIGANIIRWTGLDADAQEQRLKDAKKLYETAAKDFEYLLGQGALPILERIEAKHVPVSNQHKMLARYAREKDRAAAEVAKDQLQCDMQRQLHAVAPANIPPPAVAIPYSQPDTAGKGGAATSVSKEGLPPGWDELFQPKATTSPKPADGRGTRGDQTSALDIDGFFQAMFPS